MKQNPQMQRKEWTSKFDSRPMRAKFAARVLARRKERGIGQTDLARKIGVSVQTINNVENGHSFPSFPLYVEICRKLEMGQIPFISPERKRKERVAGIDLQLDS